MYAATSGIISVQGGEGDGVGRLGVGVRGKINHSYSEWPEIHFDFEIFGIR